jgi:hypothetical protein
MKGERVGRVCPETGKNLDAEVLPRLQMMRADFGD